jgi:hypothetical protein
MRVSGDALIREIIALPSWDIGTRLIVIGVAEDDVTGLAGVAVDFAVAAGFAGVAAHPIVGAASKKANTTF